MGYGAEGLSSVLKYNPTSQPSILMTLGLFHLNWHYLKCIHQIYWSFGYQSMLRLVKQSWVGSGAKLYQSSYESISYDL